MTERDKDAKAADRGVTTTDPAEATELQSGVDQILVDHELGDGKTVRIPQPKRKRVVFKY